MFHFLVVITAVQQLAKHKVCKQNEAAIKVSHGNEWRHCGFRVGVIMQEDAGKFKTQFSSSQRVNHCSYRRQHILCSRFAYLLPQCHCHLSFPDFRINQP
jgi:hypothetical protein